MPRTPPAFKNGVPFFLLDGGKAKSAFSHVDGGELARAVFDHVPRKVFTNG